jgi:hypothetical protein
MIELMKDKWKISSVVVPNTIFNSPNGMGNTKSSRFKNMEKRKPAQEEQIRQEVPVSFWVSLIFVIIIFSYVFIKLGRSEHQHKSE